MSIVTFYSYKGGVGRSMALANIAVELVKRQKRVLMVDWDLEAPGLEKYFEGTIRERRGAGLLPMLLNERADTDWDYKPFLWKVILASGESIDLLHSGRE